MPSTEPPIIQPGSIWDGVTEYQSEYPVGYSAHWFCRMYPDGTRRISDAIGTCSRVPYNLGLLTDRDGWESIGDAIENPVGGTRYDLPDYRHGAGFLHYDGTVNAGPANQHFDLQNYREHAARFGHQLDAAMGHHTLASADVRDSLVVLQTLSDMIGSAWKRYEVWEATDPEELVIGGNNDGIPLWKVQKSEYDAIDAGLCGQCDIATYARRFLLAADLPAFRLAYRQGIVNAADRSTTPWGLLPFEIVLGNTGEFHELLQANYHEALHHYDHVVGVREHA